MIPVPLVSMLIHPVSNDGRNKQSDGGTSMVVLCSVAGINLGMGSANERRHYIVTLSLIGWAHSQIDPWCGPDVAGLVQDCRNSLLIFYKISTINTSRWVYRMSVVSFKVQPLFHIHYCLFLLETCHVCSIFPIVVLYSISCLWFNARLQYLQCVSNGDTAALH